MACYLQDGVFYEKKGRVVAENNFRKKIHLIFHRRGSEFDSDLKDSDKEYIHLAIYVLHMIYCVGKAIYK